MGKATTAACSSTSSELKCFIHSESASGDDLKPFKSTTWAKVLTSAAIWKYSDGKKTTIATDFPRADRHNQRQGLKFHNKQVFIANVTSNLPIRQRLAELDSTCN